MDSRFQVLDSRFFINGSWNRTSIVDGFLSSFPPGSLRSPIFLFRGAWSQAKDAGFLKENKNHGIRIPLHVAIRPSVILYIFNIAV